MRAARYVPTLCGVCKTAEADGSIGKLGDPEYELWTCRGCYDVAMGRKV